MKKTLLLSLLYIGAFAGTSQATPTQVSTGLNNTCYIDSGQLYCQGDNTYGQLGTGSTGSPQTSFSAVPGMTSITKVSVGINGNTICALTTAGVPYCWGQNNYGQVGDNTNVDKYSPTLVHALPSGFAAIDLQTSGDHTCALDINRYGSCWGDNTHGQLNIGTFGGTHWIPAAFYMGLRNQEMSVGRFVTCTVKDAGYGYLEAGCAGSDDRHQIYDTGNLTTVYPDRVIDVRQDFAYPHGEFGNVTHPAKHIAAGWQHTCVTDSTDTVYCRGANDYGQLGLGSASSADQTYTAVTGLGAMTEISVGGLHTCADNSTTGYCWGNGSNYQLDTGTAITTQSIPLDLPIIHRPATSMTAGNQTTCFIHSGTVVCVGADGAGGYNQGPPNCGNGVLNVGEACDDNNGTSGDGCSATCAIEVGYACSGIPSTCSLLCGNGVLDAGEVCDDHNTSNGDGCSSTCQIEPGYVCSGTPSSCTTPPANMAPGLRSSAGSVNTCKITSADALYCWGDNSNGQIDGTFTNKTSPTAISGMSSGVTDVSVSGDGYTICAIKSGSLYCWGDNAFGQVGDGTTTDRTTPTLVSSLSNVVRVAESGNHTCALVLVTGNELAEYCWGDNTYGGLGLGTTGGTHNSPTLTTATGVRDIATNRYTTCDVKSGNVYCWGRNDWGQLGIGSTTNTSSRGTAATTGVHVTMGWNHTCSSAADGHPQCWGANDNGQIGVGNCGSYAPCVGGTAMYTTAHNASLLPYTSLSAGGSATCGINSSSQIICWGYGGTGMMGHGWASPNGCEYYTGTKFSRVLNEVCNASAPTSVGLNHTVSGSTVAVGGLHVTAFNPSFATGPKVLTWGANAEGEIGDGSTVIEYIPDGTPNTLPPTGGW